MDTESKGNKKKKFFFLSHLKKKNEKKKNIKHTQTQINEINYHLNHSNSISILCKALRVDVLGIIGNNG